MEFRITITDEADSQLKALTAREQRIIESAILARLIHQPNHPSTAIKLLRLNPYAQFELRVGDLRLLYDVDTEACEVTILIVGRKVGNALIVGGKEFHEHRDDSTQPATDEPPGPPQ
jgi:mRNA-degrading endonuclease RelE of RelBE toxin-antitoxin system